MYLSIIIPAYNEEMRLGNTLEKMSSYFNAKEYRYEIIVIDDGSTDNTRQIALENPLNSAGKLSILCNTKNKGKGFSVKKGILASRGDFVLFSDADLSTPIEEIDKLLSYSENGYDIVIGSRGTKDSDVRVRQVWYREAMGRMFNLLIRIFIMNNFSDTQCGFKLLKSDVAKNIFKNMSMNRFSFDVEMLYMAKLNNCKIKEVGVVWINSTQSKVKSIESSFFMLIDLFKIKALHK